VSKTETKSARAILPVWREGSERYFCLRQYASGLLAASGFAGLVAVGVGVRLGGFARVMSGLMKMALGGVSVVGGGFVVAGFVMLGGFAMVLRSVVVMIGSLGVMFSSLFGHGLSSV
jgi:hypothetical protein